MRFASLAAYAASLLALACNAQQGVPSKFSPARPPAIPLAVRSPYMSIWQQAGSLDGAGNGGYLAGEWPTFWQGQIVGWAGMIRVDGLAYTWMGAPQDGEGVTPPVANQTAFSYTATKSVFEMNVGGFINMNITFFSNVAPTDYKRQSLPYSYLEVTLQSLDGKPHSVQLYSDISAEWISGDRTAVAQWDYGVIPPTGAAKRDAEPEIDEALAQPALEKRQSGNGPFKTYGTKIAYTGWTTAVTHSTPTQLPKTSGFINPVPPQSPARSKTSVNPHPAPSPAPPKGGGIAYHQVFRQTQLLWSEVAQQTEYGNWYYMTNNSADLTHQQGASTDVRYQFIADGFLINNEDTNYRPIDDAFPVFAFSFDIGNVTTPVSRLWGISLNQESCVQFESYSGNVSVPCLWTDYFPNDLDAISFYYNDYQTALGMAATLDQKIAADSVAVSSSNYALLTTLATRQAFGGLEFTNTTETPLVFFKEISSDGNVNTVDVIFPFHPIAIYLNPTILKQLLDPLFINQEAGYWPFLYSIHDIGAAFPNATGHNDGNAEMQPLEECGDMILMTLAYAQRANDNAYLTQHYPILRQWNDYLVAEALIPLNQISTDDFAGSLANQTNLAIKGIIGIEAMAQIANRTGNFADSANYTKIAHRYIRQWQTLGIAANENPPHSTLAYGMNTTHGLLYNIYTDKELGLGLVPQSVYDMQSRFYPTIEDLYGVPLDTRHTYTKSDWELFCAAVASNHTKAMFVNDIAKWVQQTDTNLPTTDLYDALNGSYPYGIDFIARPVLGGWFANLALLSAP